MTVFGKAAFTAAAITMAAGLAFAAPAARPDPRLVAVIDSPLRPAAEKARDVYRHPAASLTFWGLKGGDTVIDVSPGAGWWTDILAPYLKNTGGHYIAAGAGAAFKAKYAANDARYGEVKLVDFGRASGPLAAPGSVDLVLVSREIHDWAQVPGYTHKALAEIYAALKPGGILAVEDHRAPEGADPKKGDGYVSESYVIGEARGAGFRLAARSQINANPKDTRNHPFGVWTLPPTRRSAPAGSPPNPAFDHAPYDAIGESDRMTLRFVKPG